jgi:dihydroneopterin aldolase
MATESQSDTIFLQDLKVETVVGIWDWERKIRQTVSIDIEMAADVVKAAETDNIEGTLNYKAVAKRVQQFVGDSEYQLIETLAEKLAETILSEFDIPWIQLRVSKPGAIRNAKNVGVVIHRRKV